LQGTRQLFTAHSAREKEIKIDLEQAHANLQKAAAEYSALQGSLEARDMHVGELERQLQDAARHNQTQTVAANPHVEALKKQVEELQANLQSVKQRAKDAIKEAFAAAAAQTGGQRRGGATVDVESRQSRSASMDSIDTGLAQVVEGDRRGLIYFAKQTQAACLDAVRKRDAAGLWRLRFILALLVYVGIVHGVLLSVWWSCKAL